MAKNSAEATEKPNLSSGAFYFGSSVVLVLVAVILTIGTSFRSRQLTFGSCQLVTEFARTTEEKATGLSGRPTLADNYAMVFTFEDEQPYFWMKNMLIPIDIVWVENGEVVKVDASLPPDNGLVHYQAPVPIDHVIEVRSGKTAACDVKVGTKLTDLIF